MEPDHLTDLFARFGPIAIRRMFGGFGLYADGLIFGIVADGEIFLKVDAQSKDVFAAAGSSPFVYEGGKRPVEMSYWRLPEIAIDDPEAVAQWARLARAAALRAASTATATKKRARAR